MAKLALKLREQKRRKTVEKSRGYLEAVREGLPPEAAPAAQLVEQRIAEVEASLTT